MFLLLLNYELILPIPIMYIYIFSKIISNKIRQQQQQQHAEQFYIFFSTCIGTYLTYIPYLLFTSYVEYEQQPMEHRNYVHVKTESSQNAVITYCYNHLSLCNSTSSALAFAAPCHDI
jgi:predicted histidine transporter YuiF (NhaC family)